MMKQLPLMRMAIACLAATLVLGGCNPMSSLKSLTGQKDNTVLPGQREDILPPDQQVLQDKNVRKQGGGNPVAAPCDPADPACKQDNSIYGDQ